jgi:type III pantothenate kinase
MILLLDIGNTHTHLGLADGQKVVKRTDILTVAWTGGTARTLIKKFVGSNQIKGVAMACVVPRVRSQVTRTIHALFNLKALELSHRTIRGVGIDYPKPASLGADRLANAVAAHAHFGGPVLVLSFGTASTLDVVDARGKFIGGIIAPGLASMLDYLHEKTAQLPRIQIRDVKTAIGKSTEQAMQIGVVHGYRGLVQGLIAELKRELKVKQLPVVATGGCAELVALRVPEIARIMPELTLEGLRLVWQLR